MNLLRAGYTSIACGCLMICTGTQRGALLEEGVKSGLTTCEQAQVQAAIRTIRAAGYTQAANDIGGMLLNGKLISDPSLTGTYRGATAFPIVGDQVIRLSKSELFCKGMFWNRRNERLYSRYAADRKVLLASTLVHEWWHSKCGYVWTMSHPFERERQAWKYEAKFLAALRESCVDIESRDFIDTALDMVHLELKSC